MPASTPRPTRLTRRDPVGETGWLPGDTYGDTSAGDGDTYGDGYDAGYGEQLPRRGPGARTWALSLLAAAVIGAVIGLISVRINQTPTLPPLSTASPGATSGSSTGPAGSPLAATVTSYDPLPTGSGLAAGTSGGAKTWSTQQYRGANFAGLKAGVGLLVDFGSPKAVTSVTFTALTPGFTVQLLAGDSAPVQGGISTTQPLPVASAQQQATASTTLRPQSSTAHRYWMVWITNLAGSGSTYSASLTTPAFSG